MSGILRGRVMLRTSGIAMCLGWLVLASCSRQPSYVERVIEAVDQFEPERHDAWPTWECMAAVMQRTGCVPPVEVRMPCELVCELECLRRFHGPYSSDEQRKVVASLRVMLARSGWMDHER